jgi:hypothetical protein
MKSKRQTTKAKLARERLVRERRTLKREKKRAAAAGDETGATPDTEQVEGDASTQPAE